MIYALLNVVVRIDETTNVTNQSKATMSTHISDRSHQAAGKMIEQSWSGLIRLNIISDFVSINTWFNRFNVLFLR